MRLSVTLMGLLPLLFAMPARWLQKSAAHASCGSLSSATHERPAGQPRRHSDHLHRHQGRSRSEQDQDQHLGSRHRPRRPAAARLTNATKADQHPRWSPDSKQILFESTLGEGQALDHRSSWRRGPQLTSLSTGSFERHLVARRQEGWLRLRDILNSPTNHSRKAMLQTRRRKRRSKRTQ